MRSQNISSGKKPKFFSKKFLGLQVFRFLKVFLGFQVLPRDASAKRGYEIACRPSVRPSVCDDQVPCSNTLDFFENNFTTEQLKVNALGDAKHGRSANGNTPKIRVEQGWGHEHIKRVLAPKRCKIGPKLLLRTNRKSHMRFRLAPISVTLDDPEGPKCLSFRNRKVLREVAAPTRKK